MKNFPIKTPDGKEYWISRACAVVAILFAKIDDNLFVLANKRGKGTPDFQGCWNCPCGYLDYDEDVFEAAAREVNEETGIVVKPEELSIVSVNSNPKENRQNVTIRLAAILPADVVNQKFNLDHMEEDEVEDVGWINVNFINNYQWAFGHETLIKKVLDKLNGAPEWQTKNTPI